ncbi:MAG: hypothetical protein M5U01_06240 [Ardenticatenaceae bacterium]|nr:hypothetical protein [Ardenticatenaceae bacterium]
MRESRLWLLSLGSTVLILVLLGAHFAIMHYSPVFTGQSVEATRSFEAMLARGRDVGQFTVYILFLAAALYHGLYGLRGVVLELPITRGRDRAVSVAILLIGFVFFVYGSYVTWWTFVNG